jgi:hypothetical protein
MHLRRLAERVAEFPGARHDVLNETVHREVATVRADFVEGAARTRRARVAAASA